MIIYKTLEGTSMEELHSTFLEAFSDYQVKMDMPLIKLQNMLQRRGYVPAASLGAFESHRLVGFLLNGIRSWQGELTAYDTGTAVIESFRKQGITSSMFLKAKSMLEHMGVKQYLLEVIQANTAAVQLYKKQGFEITRDFQCFSLDKYKHNAAATIEVEHISIINEGLWQEFTKFWDFKPSWQNSMDSVNASSHTLAYSVAAVNGIIAGYGVIDKITGDIPQLAVDKNYRGRGIGGSILADLVKSTEANNIKVLNVDKQCNAMKDFLMNQGFQENVSQYEMILKF